MAATLEKEVLEAKDPVGGVVNPKVGGINPENPEARLEEGIEATKEEMKKSKYLLSLVTALFVINIGAQVDAKAGSGKKSAERNLTTLVETKLDDIVDGRDALADTILTYLSLGHKVQNGKIIEIDRIERPIWNLSKVKIGNDIYLKLILLEGSTARVLKVREEEVQNYIRQNDSSENQL